MASLVGDLGGALGPLIGPEKRFLSETAAKFDDEKIIHNKLAVMREPHGPFLICNKSGRFVKFYINTRGELVTQHLHHAHTNMRRDTSNAAPPRYTHTHKCVCTLARSRMHVCLWVHLSIRVHVCAYVHVCVCVTDDL